MIYKATIVNGRERLSREFTTLFEAAQWLDSQSNNMDATTIIETFDDVGNKKDGFFYTEKAK